MDELRHQDEVRARRGRRLLHAAAGADATLSGLLVDLAERGVVVVIEPAATRAVRGRIELVGRDCVSVRAVATGATWVIPFGAVVSVWPGRSQPARPAGQRDGPRPVSFAAVVGELAALRAQVAVLAASATVEGTLHAAGADVATLVTANGAAAYVALAQVSALVVLASG